MSLSQKCMTLVSLDSFTCKLSLICRQINGLFNVLFKYFDCLLIVVWLFLMVPQGCLQFVIVVFSDHTHLLFRNALCDNAFTGDKQCFIITISCTHICQSLHNRNVQDLFLVGQLFVYHHICNKICAVTCDFQRCGMCDQQSLRSACAYAQSDQSIC